MQSRPTDMGSSIPRALAKACMGLVWGGGKAGPRSRKPDAFGPGTKSTPGASLSQQRSKLGASPEKALDFKRFDAGLGEPFTCLSTPPGAHIQPLGGIDFRNKGPNLSSTYPMMIGTHQCGL